MSPVDRKKLKPRYRKVSIRMWNDENFLALSSPAPNARDLWIWLITGPFTTPVPGVVLATMGGIADRLGWPPQATRRCWEEIEARRMATADWSNALIWLPKALEHNPPESCNVVVSWRKFLDEHVPECPLRAHLEACALRFLEGMASHGKSKGFAEAFGRVYAGTIAEGTPGTFGDTGTGTGSVSTPQPPSGEGGGELTRPITRAERKFAESVRRAYGRCPHTPQCLTGGECIGRLVAGHRRELQYGLQDASRVS